MDPIIEKDVAAFSRIAAVDMILETLQKLTGLRLSIVARVDESSWTACAVLDNLNNIESTGANRTPLGQRDNSPMLDNPHRS